MKETQKFYKVFYQRDGKLYSCVSGFYENTKLSDYNYFWEALHTHCGLQYKVGVETLPRMGAMYGYNNYGSAFTFATSEGLILQATTKGRYVVYECEGRVLPDVQCRTIFSTLDKDPKEFLENFWSQFLEGGLKEPQEFEYSLDQPDFMCVLSCTPLKEVFN